MAAGQLGGVLPLAVEVQRRSTGGQGDTLRQRTNGVEPEVDVVDVGACAGVSGEHHRAPTLLSDHKLIAMVAVGGAAATQARNLFAPVHHIVTLPIHLVLVSCASSRLIMQGGRVNALLGGVVVKGQLVARLKPANLFSVAGVLYPRQCGYSWSRASPRCCP